MLMVVNQLDLPGSETSRQFEGYLYKDGMVSFFINETPPNRGPSLHMHPYQEIFVVLEGQLTCTVGDTTIEAKTGQIVIVPPDTPHKFINSSTEVTRHIDIHASAQMITTWLEE